MTSRTEQEFKSQKQINQFIIIVFIKDSISFRYTIFVSVYKKNYIFCTARNVNSPSRLYHLYFTALRKTKIPFI